MKTFRQSGLVRRIGQGLAMTIAMVVAGCTTVVRPPPQIVYRDVAPPARIVEAMPPIIVEQISIAPSPSHRYVRGHWHWAGNHWAWSRGGWVY